MAKAPESTAFGIGVQLKPMKREGRIRGRWKKVCDYDNLVIEALRRYGIDYKTLTSRNEGRRLIYGVLLKEPVENHKICALVEWFCEKRKLELDYRVYRGPWMHIKLNQK